MILERTLFLILQEASPFEINGFGEENRKEFNNDQRIENINKFNLNLIDKIFQLRNLLKAVSSGNPYEKYDAIFNNQSDRLNIFKHIRLRITKIEDLLKYCD